MTIIIIVMSLGKHITLEDIKEYCRKNSYATSKLNIDTSRLSDEPLIETAITCKSSINTISFYTFYEPAPESWFTDSIPSDGTIIILGEGKNYIKIYHDPDVGASYDGYHHNYVVYGIVDGKEIITVSSPDEATAMVRRQLAIPSSFSPYCFLKDTLTVVPSMGLLWVSNSPLPILARR